MNKKICFYTTPLAGMSSYYDIIDFAAGYKMSFIEGFSQFELELPDRQAAERIREYADRKNIGFSCLSVFIDLVGEDSEEMIQQAKDFADIAKILGSPYLHHTIACNFYDPEAVTARSSEYFQKGIRAVREIYDYADSIGIKTVYEDQGFIFNGTDGFGRFLSEVGRDVGVVADFGNITQAGGRIEDFIKAFSDRICHVHIKDVHLEKENLSGRGFKTLDGMYMSEAEIGHGCVNIKAALKLLREAGYSGYYSLEYGAPDDCPEPLDRALAYIDELLI